MKKILGLILLVMLVLVSCGRKVEEKPYEIIWHTIGTPQRDVEKVMEKVSEYTKEKIDVTVKMYMHDWGDYNQKMQVLSASGEPYDLAFTSSWAFDYRVNAGRGAFLPLNNLINKYGEELKKTIHPALLEGSKINGKIYGIPANKEIAYQQVFRINDTYKKKYNMDLSNVKTLEDLEPFFQIIKENEPDVIPFAVYGNIQYLLQDYDFVMNGRIPGAIKISDGNLKVINQWEDEEFIKHMKVYRKFFERGYIPKDAVSVTDNPNITKTGKWFVTLVEYQPLAENLWESVYGYPCSVIPAMEKPIIATRSVSGSMMAISSNSEQPEKVMKFLNLLNTDSYLRNMIDSGIEGIHYEKIADNRVRMLPASSDYDMPTFSLGNMFITYLNEADPENKWEVFEEWNSTALESPLLGFNFDITPVRSELAAITNVAEEFGSGLFTGGYDSEVYLSQAIEKFEAVGLNKVLEEMQKQIDQWQINK